jgi:site-specific DNA-adenine methylase
VLPSPRCGRGSRTRQRINIVAPQRLRPFFGYYGGKWRTAVEHYPAPEFDTIIEPFAGSAGYSLRYPSRQVVLCDLDEIVAGVWQFLIKAKVSEIRAIPDVALDGSVDDLKACQEAKWLVGFWLNRGTTRPRRSPSRWMRDGIRPGSFWGERVRSTIASQLEAIRHWKVRHGSYERCSVARKATWFVDPPYQEAGAHYRYGSSRMDYLALAQWCRARRGQVIVCENAGAEWLPFRDLVQARTTRANRRSSEVCWTHRRE